MANAPVLGIVPWIDDQTRENVHNANLTTTQSTTKERIIWGEYHKLNLWRTLMESGKYFSKASTISGSSSSVANLKFFPSVNTSSIADRWKLTMKINWDNKRGELATKNHNTAQKTPHETRITTWILQDKFCYNISRILFKLLPPAAICNSWPLEFTLF